MSTIISSSRETTVSVSAMSTNAQTSSSSGGYFDSARAKISAIFHSIVNYPCCSKLSEKLRNVCSNCCSLAERVKNWAKSFFSQGTAAPSTTTTIPATSSSEQVQNTTTITTTASTTSTTTETTVPFVEGQPVAVPNIAAYCWAISMMQVIVNTSLMQLLEIYFQEDLNYRPFFAFAQQYQAARDERRCVTRDIEMGAIACLIFPQGANDANDAGEALMTLLNQIPQESRPLIHNLFPQELQNVQQRCIEELLAYETPFPNDFILSVGLQGNARRARIEDFPQRIQIPPEYLAPGEEVTYELDAFLVNPGGGHWTTYLKTETEGIQRWWHLDDGALPVEVVTVGATTASATSSSASLATASVATASTSTASATSSVDAISRLLRTTSIVHHYKKIITRPQAN